MVLNISCAVWEKCLFSLSSVFFFFCYCVLWALCVNPLSDIWFANIFSHSVGCLFILLMVSFYWWLCRRFLVYFPLYIRQYFFLGAMYIFVLFSVFRSLSMVYLGVNFFRFIFFGIHCFLILYVFLCQILEDFSYYFFKYFFGLILFFSPQWCEYYISC